MAAILLALGLPAWAGTGSIAVTVVDDEMELPIPNAALVLTSSAMPTPREANTDGAGLATFEALPEGLYRLSVEKGGFRGRTLEDISVVSDLVSEVTVRLGPQEIHYDGWIQRDSLDPEAVTVSRELDEDLWDRLPVGGTLPMLLQTVAGADGPLGAYPRIAGGASDQSAYILNGAHVTDPVTGGMPLNVPLSGLHSAEVVAGGLLPPDTPGGGGVVSLDAAAGWNGVDLRTSFATDLDWRRASTRLTGGLVRNRAWFTLAHEQVASPEGIDSHSVLAGLVVQPIPQHRVEALVVANPSAGAGQTQGGVLAVQRWYWFVSPSSNLDTTASVQRTHLDADSAADDRFAANASSALSVYGVDDPIGGTHDVAIGAQASHGAWSVDGAPRAASDKLGGYVYDAWKPVGSLTFHVGARVDAFELRDGRGDVVMSGVTANPRAGVAWDPSRERKTKLAASFGRATDTGRLTWVDEAPVLMDEVVLLAEGEVHYDVALYASMTARRTDDTDYTRWDAGVRKVLSRRWQADATYSFTARQGHTVRGYLAWDLPTDPFTLKATAFALYTDVPALPTDSGVLRVLAPEPYVRTGEHGFVGASLLQNIDVPKGYVTLRLEGSSAWDPVAPRVLVGAEYAF